MPFVPIGGNILNTLTLHLCTELLDEGTKNGLDVMLVNCRRKNKRVKNSYFRVTCLDDCALLGTSVLHFLIQTMEGEICEDIT
jgi:hypothetical protein